MEETSDKELGVRENDDDQSNHGEPLKTESGVRAEGEDDTNNSQNNDQSSLQEHHVVVPNAEDAKPRSKVRKSTTSKQKKQTHQFNLAYFTLWWKRMEREGERKHASLQEGRVSTATINTQIL